MQIRGAGGVRQDPAPDGQAGLGMGRDGVHGLTLRAKPNGIGHKITIWVSPEPAESLCECD